MINNIVVLTKNTTPIIGQISGIFGIILNGIYDFFSNVGIESLGISIIMFTLIVRIFMIPLAFKQQKSMKEMQKIQPQLKIVQDKYKNKKDPESQQKFQMEMNKLYKEHGVSPFGGCLPMLVQFPIIISLFQVLRNIPAYIDSVKGYYENIGTKVMTIDGANSFLLEKADKVLVKDFDITNINKVIDVIGKFNSEQWTEFIDKFSSIINVIQPNFDKISEIYMFLGINLADKPDLLSIGILLPILNVLVQFMVSKTTMSSGQEQGQTQKTMMYTMPLITAFFVSTMPAGLGLYWLIGSLFNWGQQVIINSHLHKKDS